MGSKGRVAVGIVAAILGMAAIAAIAVLSLLPMVETERQTTDPGQKSTQRPDAIAARDHAAAASGAVAIAVLNMDANHVDDSMRIMRSNMTGLLRETFDTSAEKMKQSVLQSKSSVSAKLLDTALVELDNAGRSAKAIVVVGQRTGTNNETTVTYALQLALEGSTWKAEGLQPIGTPVPSAGPSPARVGMPTGAANTAFVDQAATKAVQAAASAAMQALYSFDYRQVDEYRPRAMACLTGSARPQFEASAENLATALTATDTMSTAEADPVGVVHLGLENAELLLAVTISTVRSGIVSPETTTYSTVVRMAKVDGRWLVSDLPKP
ncbi:MAG: hypothetical protein HOQ24_06855 [Mycobacteriaceae bacterium]|nr:hypothetical protein [Mycobacteriaceae bacterium]